MYVHLIKVGELGRLLGTRQLGRMLRNQIEQVRTTHPEWSIVLDFAGVEIITVSFADEAIGRLPPPRAASAGARLSFRSYNENVAAVLTYVLSRRSRGT